MVVTLNLSFTKAGLPTALCDELLETIRVLRTKLGSGLLVPSSRGRRWINKSQTI